MGALVSGAWSDEDVVKLRQMFANGATVRILAICLNRTGSSVTNKLVQQKLLVCVGGQYIKPWTDWTEINEVDLRMKKLASE